MTRRAPVGLQQPTVDVLADPGAPFPVVRLTGDLDDSVVPALLDALTIAGREDTLHIDATAVRSWETATLRAFIAIRRHLGAQGRTVDVVGVGWHQVVDLLLRIPLDEVAGVAALVRELQRDSPRRLPIRVAGS